MNQLTPIVGQWYLRTDGLKFEVVDVDNGDGYIELQDEDGLMDQIGSDDWPRGNFGVTTQPESLSAAFDTLFLLDEDEAAASLATSKVEDLVPLGWMLRKQNP